MACGNYGYDEKFVMDMEPVQGAMCFGDWVASRDSSWMQTSLTSGMCSPSRLETNGDDRLDILFPKDK